MMTLVKFIKVSIALLFYCLLQLLLMLFLNNCSYGQLAAGTYTVGTSGTEDYSSLTNTGGLFQVINTSGLAGDIIVQVVTDLPAETGTYSINQWAGSYSVTIQPQSASVRTINYSGSCSDPLINVNGADNFIIDGSFGGSGRYLEFTSACTDRNVIRYSGDCINNSLMNCILRSDNNSYSSSDGGIVNLSSTQVNGCDNMLISNNLLTDLGGTLNVFYGIQANEPSAGDLENLVITRNEFYNINGKGIHVREQTGAGIVIAAQVTRNHFYNDQPITGPGAGWVLAAVEFESGRGHLIRGNYIGGQAPYCAGGHAQIDLSDNQTVQVALIRILSTTQTPFPFTNPDIIQIDSNVFRKIIVQTGTVSGNIGFIRTDGGHCNIGTAYPNYIGDATSDASLSPSVAYLNNYNYTGTSEQNIVRLVHNESPGTVNIENNQVGSLSFKSNMATGKASVNILYSNTAAVTSEVNIRSNQVGGVSNSIYKTCDDHLRMVYSSGENGQVLIRDNQFTGITTDSNMNDACWIIRCSSGNAPTSVINNIISNVQIGSGTQTASLEAIYSNRPLSMIDSNEISNIQINSLFSGNQFSGISVSRNSSLVGISYNDISAISVINTSSAISSSSYGISVSGSSSFTLRCNFIDQIYNTNNNTSTTIRGITNSATGTNNFVNNVILLDNGSNANNILIYGIFDNSGAGTNNYSHNTIAIRGANSGGGQRSACYYSSGTGVIRNLRNNIFSNQRVGGTAGHYALYFVSTSGTINSDYNLLYAQENTGKLARYGANMTFTAWQGAGFDAGGVTGLTSQDLVDFSNGHQTTTLGNDIGSTMVGVSYDHDFTGRPIGSGFDMGAFEIETPNLGSPLPVELVLFEAACAAGKTILHWITKSEIQNDYFLLEASLNGTDWAVVSETDGAGNSSSQREYYVEYVQRDAGITYFRLKQVDYDGTDRVHELISADCYDMQCNEFTYKVSEGELYLFFANDCLLPDAMVYITDVRGRLIRSQKLNGTESVGVVPVHGLGGVYIIQVVSGSSVYALKAVL